MSVVLQEVISVIMIVQAKVRRSARAIYERICSFPAAMNLVLQRVSHVTMVVGAKVLLKLWHRVLRLWKPCMPFFAMALLAYFAGVAVFAIAFIALAGPVALIGSVMMTRKSFAKEERARKREKQAEQEHNRAKMQERQAHWAERKETERVKKQCANLTERLLLQMQQHQEDEAMIEQAISVTKKEVAKKGRKLVEIGKIQAETSSKHTPQQLEKIRNGKQIRGSLQQSEQKLKTLKQQLEVVKQSKQTLLQLEQQLDVTRALEQDFEQQYRRFRTITDKLDEMVRAQ